MQCIASFIDPMKRGLKLFVNEIVVAHAAIASFIDPMKRGLKRGICARHIM
jgi:hypothetical protein